MPHVRDRQRVGHGHPGHPIRLVDLAQLELRRQHGHRVGEDVVPWHGVDVQFGPLGELEHVRQLVVPLQLSVEVDHHVEPAVVLAGQSADVPDHRAAGRIVEHRQQRHTIRPERCHEAHPLGQPLRQARRRALRHLPWPAVRVPAADGERDPRPGPRVATADPLLGVEIGPGVRRLRIGVVGGIHVAGHGCLDHVRERQPLHILHTRVQIHPELDVRRLSGRQLLQPDDELSIRRIVRRGDPRPVPDRQTAVARGRNGVRVRDPDGAQRPITDVLDVQPVDDLMMVLPVVTLLDPQVGAGHVQPLDPLVDVVESRVLIRLRADLDGVREPRARQRMRVDVQDQLIVPADPVRHRAHVPHQRVRAHQRGRHRANEVPVVVVRPQLTERGAQRKHVGDDHVLCRDVPIVAEGNLEAHPPAGHQLG